MNRKLNYHRFVLCKKLHKKTPIEGEVPIVENSGFSQNSKRWTKGKSSKMAECLGNPWKAKKIGNTIRIIALLVCIEGLTIVNLYYAKTALKKDYLRRNNRRRQ